MNRERKRYSLMVTITNIRIENGEIAIFKMNTGETLTYKDLKVKMIFGEKYSIRTSNGTKELKWNSDGTEIVMPPLKELQYINTL